MGGERLTPLAAVTDLAAEQSMIYLLMSGRGWSDVSFTSFPSSGHSSRSRAVPLSRSSYLPGEGDLTNFERGTRKVEEQ